MTSTCETYYPLTSFTMNCLVKGDSKQASKQALNIKQIIHDVKGPCAEQEALCTGFLRLLYNS